MNTLSQKPIQAFKYVSEGKDFPSAREKDLARKGLPGCSKPQEAFLRQLTEGSPRFFCCKRN